MKEIEQGNNVPESIDVWTRNRRVAKMLTKMGLVVIPVLNSVNEMDHLIVSCGMPCNYQERGHSQG